MTAKPVPEHISDERLAELTRPIVAIENRTPQEAFDIMCDRIRRALAASPSSPASGVRVKALADVAAERKRQMDAEGWTPEHDDAHSKGELAQAAGVYALAAGSHDYRWVLQGLPVNDYLAAAMKLWPWHKSWWKPKDRRRDLVRAGALIVAEIERLDRRSALGEHP